MNKMTNEKKFNYKGKNLIIITSIFVILLFISYVCKNILTLTKAEQINLIMYLHGANNLLGLISIPCCFLYYCLYKNEEFFILALSYTTLFIDYLFVSLSFQWKIVFSYSMIFSFLIRHILLYLAIKRESKFSKVIIKGRYISIFIVSIISIIALFFETYLRLNIEKLGKVFPLLNLTTTIFYIILLILFSKKYIQKDKFIYTMFIISISAFIIRRLFFEYSYNNLNITIIACNQLLSCLGFLILLIGIYIETLRKIKINEKLDDEVKQNKKLIEGITDNIDDIIFTTDSCGKIVYVNKSATEKLGFSKEELIGINYKSIIENQEKYLLNNKDKNIVFNKYKCKCKNGQILNTESVITKILDDNNVILGKVIVARDSSIKEKIEKINMKYVAIKETENLRNQFFANITHEFKTPINIIYSCMQLLDAKKEQSYLALLESYEKYKGNIKQNCNRMLRLVNNLVDISKIDSGFVNLEFANNDIVNLVENIVLSVAPYVENNNINITFDTFVEEIEIKCDADSIERIILNLLSNAIKFTDENGSILVEMDSDDEWVIIKVRDNGIGIPDKFKEIIFDRFVQGDKSLNRKKEGSGIGLALVKSLVEFHNGTIEVNKEYRDGSEFILKLPNVKIPIKEEENKRIVDINDKKLIEKIDIEFSDIYELSS